jgi:peptide/nickel transport system permease protein
MTYVLQRTLHTISVLLLISILSFIFVEAAPGSYVDELRLNPKISTATILALRSRYGVDRPLPVKYWMWVASLFRGEFGFSFSYGMPVGSLLWPRAKYTLILTSVATALSWCIALVLGAFSALTRNRPMHSIIRGSVSILASAPDLLIAVALLMLAVRTERLSVAGMRATMPSAGAVAELDTHIAAHLFFPVMAITCASLPSLISHVQAAVQEAAASPFIQAARAHGIPRRRLLLVYTLPAAANPLISLLGLSIGGLLSTSLLVEVIMGWPGLGPLVIEAVFSRDIHIVISATVLSALFLLAGNLISDVLLYAADPRIRKAGGVLS